MTVFVEASCLEDVHLKNNPIFIQVREKIRTFRDGKDDLTDKVDFIVCLGGDGTLLYASSLFQVAQKQTTKVVDHNNLDLTNLILRPGECPPGDGLPHGLAWLPHAV